MAPLHVLVVGGHGKVAQHLTPLLLKRSWTVTSLIRAQEQVPTIQKLGSGQPGQLNVLVSSIEDVDSQDKAIELLREIKPDLIAFSAGELATFRIDRDAASHLIRAAATFPSIKRFLLVSYNGSRRFSAPWWPAGEWDEYNKQVNHGPLARYYQAKLSADEVLYQVSKASSTLVGIDLRPCQLTLEPAGKVELGKSSHAAGLVSRESVARVADALLAAEGVKNTWLDLADGDEDIDAAVERVIREGVDAAEGDPVFEQ
ncbi:Nucleoside-diphosphate-sugar epimerase [Geosmithia morbida]|uniref:Nucleoside-diphosphate-sugar epimerase n=1 Tax=Geosmithia morbida TaxID=1094350 RepID=A0A9P4Z5A0_9HYPO|nr:Nucleoside-diphosphate-sugar epimerase [Geosmithia morbida]KAF4126944.1 Nucleoside-diphosphate-sugar epimerase [Geosmithia morbida]